MEIKGDRFIQMHREDQTNFVRALCNAIRDSVCKEIRRGNAPSHWTGMQLRQWLADRFDAATIRRTRAQTRQYNNEKAIHNL
jgi:hypothetical protein